MAEEQTLEEVVEEQEQASDVQEPEIELPEEAAEEAVDEVTSLREELEKAQARENEYLDGWQRARAELSNARKRFQREQEQSYSLAKADVLIRLLPVVDDFERAVETMPDDLADHAWLEGVLLILRKLQALLEQDGVAPIEAEGREFDPFAHQAVTHEPNDEVPEGHVIAEMQKGYTMGERVLRPSVVRVSSGPMTPSPAEDESAPEDEAADQKEP